MSARSRPASLAAAWVLVGCAHLPPDARSGRDRVADGAAIVELPRHRPSQAWDGGKVSTPRGDRTDWLYVRMPGLGGGPVELTLTWKPRRGGPANLTVALYAVDGTPLGELRTVQPRTLAASFDASPTMPGFFVVVQATGWKDAASYQLTVDHQPADSGPPEVALIEELPAVPAIDETSGAFEPGPEPCSPEWVRRGGTCNPPRPDPVDPAVPAPAPTEVTARIINVVADGKASEITLGAGSNDGVDVGWRGRIAGLAGGAFTITSVAARSSRARVKASVDDIRATSMKVTLRP